MIKAVWRTPHPDHLRPPGQPSGSGIDRTVHCGRVACRAYFGADGGRNRVLLHAGLVRDPHTGMIHLAEHAREPWRRARASGQNWADFTPSARHPRRGADEIDALHRRLNPEQDPRPYKMVRIWVTPPVEIRCPLCRWLNTIEPFATS